MSRTTARLIGTRLRARRAAAFSLAVVAVGTSAGATSTVSQLVFPDPTGYVATVDSAGAFDQNNEFFQSLGTNGRSCSTCHVASQGFSFSAAGAQARFASSHGADPLFVTVDGANCPGDPRGDVASHSLLLNHGLIRVRLTVPANAQFAITAIHGPYGCAMVTDAHGAQTVSVYRRPLPATNLRFSSVLMFDGRETLAPLDDRQTFFTNLVTDLEHQAVDATLGHAEASSPPTPAQVSSIVGFELALSTAQLSDNAAGLLFADGARGGPALLALQTYYPGINDSLGGDPSGAPFDPAVFTLFDAWAYPTPHGSLGQARAAIAAGERIFNERPLTITGVRGLNDNPALGRPTSINGTCSTCHDTPNVGNHSFPLPLDIGTSHVIADEAALRHLSLPDVPVYEITGCVDPVTGQPVTFHTSDPGRALITGLCSDVNRIKGPILRGLAARAPYFHNGAAVNVTEVVNFYDERFQMGLTDVEKAQLAAFLGSL